MSLTDSREEATERPLSIRTAIQKSQGRSGRELRGHLPS